VTGQIVLAVFIAAACLHAQEEEAPAPIAKPAATKTAREQAPIDLTGYWTAVITQDWRWRMVTPKKGDFPGIPLNAEGKKLANAWDPAKDEAEGQQCRSYGAAALMRVPGRFHIAWENETTLRVDADAGRQTRLFHFGAQAPADTEPGWQGYSVAEWEYGNGRGPGKGGDLKIVTTHLLPGYLRKNSVPYSGNTVVSEYYDLIDAPNGDQWLVVSTEVRDPQYLTMPFITSTHFKKLPDASGWDPEPCSAQ